MNDTMHDDYVADAKTHECDDECMEAWIADLPAPMLWSETLQMYVSIPND